MLGQQARTKRGSLPKPQPNKAREVITKYAEYADRHLIEEIRMLRDEICSVEEFANLLYNDYAHGNTVLETRQYFFDNGVDDLQVF